MDPGPKPIDDLLPSGGSIQYRVPAYQRRYSWDREQLHGLWRDVGALLAAPTGGPHFCGVLLLKVDRLGEGAISSVREVIDGQQRLITILLLLAAVRDHEAESERRSVAFDFDPLVHLFRPGAPGEARPTEHRLIKCFNPEEDLRLEQVLHGQWRNLLRAKQTGSLIEAYTYFRYCLWMGVSSFSEPEAIAIPTARTDAEIDNLEAFWSRDFNGSRTSIDCKRLADTVRSRITLLLLAVTDGDEDPILIFDAINGRRLEFSQWDHAKTLLFRRLGDETTLYQQWTEAERGIENAIRINGKRGQNFKRVADGFLYDFVIARSRSVDERPRLGRSAIQLRKLLQAEGSDPPDAELRRFINTDFLVAAQLYRAVIAPGLPVVNVHGQHLTERASETISQIEAFSSQTARPIILSVLNWWYKMEIADDLLHDALRAVESHHCRLFLMNEPFSPLRARMMQVMAKVNDDDSLDTPVVVMIIIM
jgi:hypothetical protein